MCGQGWGPLWIAHEKSRRTGAFGSLVMIRNVETQRACVRLLRRWQRCGCTWTAPPRTWTTQSSSWSVSRKRCCPGRFLCSSKDCKYSLLQRRHYSWHSSMPLDLDGFMLIIIIITLFVCLFVVLAGGELRHGNVRLVHPKCKQWMHVPGCLV